VRAILFIKLIPFHPDDRVEWLKRLVEINSGSRNVAGVNQIQTLIETELKTLGFSVTRTPHPEGKWGDLLVADRGPRGSHRWVTLVTHADTVFEPDSPFQKFSLSADGKRATGPGIIDDKGSLVIAIKGLQKYLKSASGDLPLRFISSPSEEIGSPGFTGRLGELGKAASMVLGFEPALEHGGIVHSRRGSRWLRVQVQGKEAHAGRDHALGINAAHELAIKVHQLEKLTRYPKLVTVNVGTMRAGTGKFNVVCGQAEALLDIRFPDVGERKKIFQAIEKELKRTHVRSHVGKKKAKTTWEVIEDCPPAPRQKVSEKYLKAYLDILFQTERKRFKSDLAGGAADSNHMSRNGLVILDGLGAKGAGTHSVQEYIELSSLYTRADALAEFLEYLSKEKAFAAL